MMSNAMIGGMLITFAGMGIVVDHFANTDAGVELLFTVPRTSYEKDVEGKEMAGKHLASRVKHSLERFGVVFSDIRYHIREDAWTPEKREMAERMARKDMGYKDWEINKSKY